MADTGIGYTTVLDYNGFTFGSNAEIKVSESPVWDDAHRTILHQEITITVSCILADPSNAALNTSLQTIRTALNEPGRPLTFANAGFGAPLLVNQLDGTGIKDVKFGPKPDVRAWEQIGSSRAVEVVWSVTVCVPTCNGIYGTRSTGVMSMNYSVSTSLNDGWTTRVMSGHIQLAMTRIPGTNRLADCADLKRDLVNPILPLGFTRMWRWELSPDKSRIEFECVDEEIRSEQAYPVNVVRASGQHRMAWRREGNIRRLYGTISMNLETTPDVSQAWGWNVFFTIVKARLGAIPQDSKRAMMLQSLEITEDLWGKASAFELSYTFLTSPKDFVADMVNSLWKPIGTDWTRWRTSMANVFGQYGNAALYTRAENDLIVDLCSNDTINFGGDREQITLKQPFEPLTFKNKKPDPKRSYYKYKNAIVPQSKTAVQRQKVLQPPQYQIASGDMNAPGSGYQAPPAGRSTDDIIQVGGTPEHSISLIGHAIRVGYPVPRPALTQAGSQQPIETYFKMPQAIIADWFGVPVYEARWRINYALANSPSSYPVQSNPAENFNGDGSETT